MSGFKSDLGKQDDPHTGSSSYLYLVRLDPVSCIHMVLSDTPTSFARNLAVQLDVAQKVLVQTRHMKAAQLSWKCGRQPICI
jgi:hypothetical protein